MTDAPSSHVLGTVPATTHWAEVRGRRRVDVVEAFDDWTVDGIALRALVAARWRTSESPTERTWLVRDFPQGAVLAVRMLLGMRPGDFDDGPVSLLVCPIDEDLECGALSTRLVLGPDVVEWRDVAWQVLRDPFVPGPDDHGPLPSFRFERSRYETVLRGLLAEYLALAAELPARDPEESLRRRWFSRRS